MSTDRELRLTPKSWAYLAEHDLVAELLDIAETDGIAAARAWLDERGLGVGGRPGPSGASPGLVVSATTSAMTSVRRRASPDGLGLRPSPADAGHSRFTDQTPGAPR